MNARDATIRDAERRDAREIAALVDAVALFPGSEIFAMLDRHFDEKPQDAAWFVQTIAEQVMGVAFVAAERMTSGTWNLLLIAIDPRFQGMGSGRALTTHVERYARAKRGRILLVETSGRPEFAKTRAVYAALGYGEEARIRDFYDVDDDKIVYRKPL